MGVLDIKNKILPLFVAPSLELKNTVRAMRRQYVLAYMETNKADFIEAMRVNSGDSKSEGERGKR